jgi:putative hydrolase of the HAD superfamily
VKPYKVILWDVYGTLLTSRAGDLQTLLEHEKDLNAAFDKVIAQFDLEEAVCRYAPDKTPANELRLLFLQRIQAVHRRKREQGIEHPEVRVEEIWLSILEELAEHGYRHPDGKPSQSDLAREVALHFERTVNPKRLVPGAWETLLELHRRKVRQGIVSNAQFYTRIELAELLRVESNGQVPTFHTIFDDLLVFMSCDFGFSKPTPAIFNHVRNVVWGEGWKVKDTLHVGNDMLNDVWCAKQAGFAAALFAGDPRSVRWRKDDPRCAQLQPDFVISSLSEVLKFV